MLTKHNFKHCSKSILAAAIGLAVASTASAQIEEVLVTASKRVENLQEVPMSISAIQGDTIERIGATDFTDIATSVPSLSLRSSGPGRTKLNIRGISAATGVASTVSFYVDEMPVSTISSGSSTSFAQAIVDPKMFDLERVEVLRGPQGTLYGSSSMGGTVRLITRKPVMEEFEGKVAAELSSTKDGGLNKTYNAMINTPISDNAALRVVGSFTDDDGYIDRVNSVTNETFAEDVNNEETVSLRATLRVDLGEDTYIQPAVFKQKTSMEGKPNVDGPVSMTEQFAEFDAPEPFDDEFTMLNVTLGHDFGFASLLVSASQLDREFTNVEDITGAFALLPFPAATDSAYSDELVELDDNTIEVRLSSNGDSALSWIVGAYQKDAESDAGYRMQRGWQDVTDFGLANTQKFQKYEETAFFGEVSYELTDKLAVLVGLRSLDYDYRSREENWGWAFNGDQDQAAANVRDEKLSGDELNSKLTVTYNINDDTQVYGTISDGTRPGGVNRVIPRSTDPAQSVGFACNNDLIALGVDDPGIYEGDKVKNTEIGVKSMIGDNIRLNGAVYRVKWQDLQQVVTTSAVCGNNFTANIGEAESTGLELDFTASISANLNVSAGLGYINAEFKDDVPSAGIESGDSLADVPELTYNISVDYVIPAASGEYFVVGTYNYVDETLEIPGTSNTDVSGNGIDSGNVRPDYGLLNLRAGYTSSEGWEALVFVDNVTDEEAIYGYNDAIAFTFPVTDPTVRNRPRTVGASISYSF